MKLLENLTGWLAVQLDKLKISNPLVFMLLQGLLVTLAGLFSMGKIEIPTGETLLSVLTFIGVSDINTLVTGFLVTLSALLGSRTTYYINK